MGKLGSLPFGSCKVAITSKDFQPSISGGIMVFVTGNLLVGGTNAEDESVTVGT